MFSLLQVPQPVKAVLLLFPINEASEKARDEDNAMLASNKAAVRACTVFLASPCSAFGRLVLFAS